MSNTFTTVYLSPEELHLASIISWEASAFCSDTTAASQRLSTVYEVFFGTWSIFITTVIFFTKCFPIGYLFRVSLATEGDSDIEAWFWRSLHFSRNVVFDCIL